MFKSELQFGLNHYSRQKTLNEKDSIAQVLSNLFFMKPGQMPSMPHLGININEYLYDFREDIDISLLKNRIAQQCAEILPYLNLEGMVMDVFDYHGAPTLYMRVPVYVDKKEELLSIGISKKSNGVVLFNYKYDESVLI